MSTTHYVVHDYDGVCDETELYAGSLEDCKNFIRRVSNSKKWKWMTQGNNSLAIVDRQANRLVSYVL